ncbi:trans-aconitate 2-methyltransferase (plasmid) [Aminobacter sp. MSH1]|uniref:class I SAM-dependent methyltransferase n=1 Tax=Aminobacter sp. MSH1 TaxID=374606 RepID=UPI0009DC5DCB|nr:class I SAM-dependent methyltransferase [Aminobacter sp. MSH1]ARD70040.1 trans-aconitate 2-methyltransferase [Aminobacter sp. MSH1]
MSDRRSHWEDVYTSKGESEVSWFEDSPETSLDLLRRAGLQPADAVIDIGGGASRLVDVLVEREQAHVSVLDLSQAALDVARARLGESAQVEWIVSDVTAFEPERMYDFWHDRAAFHFLTAEQDQAAYARVMAAALKPSGKAIIGTFAPDGPEKCSGLPVARHDMASLQQIFGPGFKGIASRRVDHTTPWGSVQRFQFSTFAKL